VGASAGSSTDELRSERLSRCRIVRIVRRRLRNALFFRLDLG
jgi:hypothetical protein